jgi:tRNA pseudouridine38-40 synthase
MADKNKNLRHIALLTEYDGSAFHGWQFQDNARSVQKTIQDTWFILTGENVNLISSSRTDAGVSASAHVSNFTTCCSIPAERVPLAFNSLLPPEVTVRAASDVQAGFNSRIDPIAKRYVYRYWQHPVRPTLHRNLMAHVPKPLDIGLMRKALPFLIGRHDFKSMMDQGSVIRKTEKNILNLELIEQHPLLTLVVEGDGFLYHMVRILAGTLLYVGQGKINPYDLPEILIAGDRKRTGKTMPPEGLCLDWVYYDPQPFDLSLRQDLKGGILYV